MTKNLTQTLKAIATLTHSERYAVFIALREVHDPDFWQKPWEDAPFKDKAEFQSLRLLVERELKANPSLLTQAPPYRGGANFQQWLAIYGLLEESKK